MQVGERGRKAPFSFYIQPDPLLNEVVTDQQNMKTFAPILFVLTLCLASCAGMEQTASQRHGNPYAHKPMPTPPKKEMKIKVHPIVRGYLKLGHKTRTRNVKTGKR